MKPERLTEFSIYVDQRPGELAGVLEAAAAAGVEVFGISVTEAGNRGCVRLVGAPEDALRHVCESLVDSGVGPVVESPVLAISIENRPGAVRDVATIMADARLNVRHIYLAPSVNGFPSRCILRLDDVDRAVRVIEGQDLPEPEVGPR